MSFQTPQEEFWANDFGDDYINRNVLDVLNIAKNLSLFGAILQQTKQVESVLEFGANIGINIHAIKQLLPNVACSAIEINSHAVFELQKIKGLEVIHQSILDYQPTKQFDFVFTKGVLIHIAPEKLALVYKSLFDSSRKYICLIEYYSPQPVEVEYRGHKQRLFKRDFAGEMLDQYSKLRLRDYGFVYRRDNHFPQDDLNWFLLEKI